ncbi:hypothetical protein Tco_0442500 [Tanacetum coccineum]
MYSIKGKEMVENAAQIPIATIIDPGMFKLDLDPLASRLLKNRDAHIDFLKYTQEQAYILQVIVKQAKAKQLLDNVVDFACKNAKQIQELLVYVRDTCPNATKPSEKLLAVTPINKVKKVRFSEPLTSSSNIRKHVESSKTPESNKPVLPSIGLKSSTSVSRSQPTSNTKNDRISCKQCMFDANHDACFLDFVNNVNVRSKSKSAKQTQQHNIWKPTGLLTTQNPMILEDPMLQMFHLLLLLSMTECALGKSKKSSHQSKVEDTNQEKLYLLDMDLCGAMHVENINGKKYIMLFSCCCRKLELAGCGKAGVDSFALFCPFCFLPLCL